MMAEGQTRFPEFERRLEKEHPVAYHEEIEQRADLVFGSTVGFLSIPLIAFFRITTGIFLTIGIALSLFSVIIVLRGFVLYRRQFREYAYRGLARKTITDAIEYIDARIAKREELLSPAPYHEKELITSYEFIKKKPEFDKMVYSTAGLLTWPSDVTKKVETDVRNARKKIPHLKVSLLVLFFILALAGYCLWVLGGVALIPLVFFPAVCILQLAYYVTRSLFFCLHFAKEDLLLTVKSSESIQLEKSLCDMLNLLQSEFSHPLRFHLVKEYPQLKYTGRTKTDSTLVRLKEAVLYPTI